MAWTTPTDRLTGDVITAAQWNSWLGATGDMSLTATGIVTTQGDTVYATAANTLARLAKGTAYQVLGMNAGATAPTWQAGATSVLTTTGDVLYASAANTLARLAVGSAGQVLTVAGGVPTWAASTASTIPSTTTGQVLYASATNVLSALAVGTARQMLAMNSGATLPTWQASAASTLTTTGDVLYASSANTLARLAVGSTGNVLTVAGGVPTWAAPSVTFGSPVATVFNGSNSDGSNSTAARSDHLHAGVHVERNKTVQHQVAWNFASAFTSAPLISSTPMGDTSSTKGRMTTIYSVSTSTVYIVSWTSSSATGAPSPNEIHVMAMEP